jgi:hypothetical protein
MSRVVDMEREASQNLRSVEKMPTKDRVMNRVAEMARGASDTDGLWERNAHEGQIDEQSSRDGKGSMSN